jgi:choline transport protein
MDEAAKSFEMRERRKSADVRVDNIDRPSVPATIDSQVRIRRLFSFTQIFMFSLTYMGLWEGMCT